MKTLQTARRFLLLLAVGFAAPGAFGRAPEITGLDAVPESDGVRLDIELTSPVRPAVHMAGEMGLLVLDFQNVDLRTPSRRIMVNHAGISDVHAAVHSVAPLHTWIVVRIDSARPLGIETTGNHVVLRILPHPVQASKVSDPPGSSAATLSNSLLKPPLLASLPSAEPPQIERVPLTTEIEAAVDDCPATVRNRFKIKYLSGSTAYIDGGANSGLRAGMNLDIRDSADTSVSPANQSTPVGAAQVVGVATSSAIVQVGSSNRDLKVGDWAQLLPADAAAAHKNVLTAPANTLHAASRAVEDDPDIASQPLAQSLRSRPSVVEDPATRTAARIGFDYSGISSVGSSPGTSLQLGMSFQSNIQRLMGTHWNLEGYWRGRISRHSRFRQPTIEDSLNKTYTMQLYYENPNSRWVAGMGRLYLPWAVSLDTVDGGYIGHKFDLGNTTGLFAGSTPDLSSWHYRPYQRIGGVFTNFSGGDYDRLHYSSTAGVALTSVRWKLDRPFAFFENELSYKGKISAYHSLIADSPQGVSTNGVRPGAGISHSYFTLHYQPARVVSFDLYHNFFRDVPTAVTSVVGTGLVDKLLFQGVSAGTHVRPTRYFTLYTTLGTSARTGDSRRSLNEVFGATLNELGRTGLRADYHYSKFNSNFGDGYYSVLSVSRQLTNRMYWNVQLGKQDVESPHTLNCDSVFVDDSFDINLGRHSYLQSGYTYVRGETMNYRQWYMSWGFRLDQGRKNPKFVQTLVPQD